MKVIRELNFKIQGLRVDRDAAYKERNQLVLVLAKLAPPGKAWLSKHPEEDKEWDDEWRTIVFLELPTGQVSWHLHDNEVADFSFLPVQPNTWDGHTTEEKYRRLRALQPRAFTPTGGQP